MPPDTPPEPPEPPRLRALRRMVMTLTATLAFGMLTITGLLAWRLTRVPPLPAPQEVALPAGERLKGYALTGDWSVLVTEDGDGAQRLHFVRRGGRTIDHTVPVPAGAPSP